jgi:hypothetical protein
MKNLKAALLLSSFLSVGSAMAADTAALPENIVQQIEQAQAQGQDVAAVIQQLIAANPELAQSIVTVAIQTVGATNEAAVSAVVEAAVQSVGADNEAAVNQVVTAAIQTVGADSEAASQVISSAIQAVGADNTVAVNQVMSAATQANVDTATVQTVALASGVAQDTVQSNLDSAPAAQVANNDTTQQPAQPAQNNTAVPTNPQAGAGTPDTGGGSGTASGN